MQPVVDFNFEMIHIIWVSILGSAKLMLPLQAHTPSCALKHWIYLTVLPLCNKSDRHPNIKHLTLTGCYNHWAGPSQPWKGSMAS